MTRGYCLSLLVYSDKSQDVETQCSDDFGGTTQYFPWKIDDLDVIYFIYSVFYQWLYSFSCMLLELTPQGF